MASGVVQSSTPQVARSLWFRCREDHRFGFFIRANPKPPERFPPFLHAIRTSSSFDSFPPTLRRLLLLWCNLRGSRHSHGDEVPSAGWDTGLRRRRRRGRTPATSTRGASRPRSEACPTQPFSHALSHAISHANQNASSSAKQARTTTD